MAASVRRSQIREISMAIGLSPIREFTIALIPTGLISS